MISIRSVFYLLFVLYILGQYFGYVCIVGTTRGWPFVEYTLAEWTGVEKQGVAT